MSAMFYNTALFDQDISSWDVGALENVSYMFNNASAFSNNDLSEWNVTNVTERNGFSTGWGSGNTEPTW